MKKEFVILLVTLFSFNSIIYARSHSQLDEGAEVLPFLNGQWDNSFQYDFFEQSYTIAMPTSLFRFGITSFAELRFQYEGALVKAPDKNWKYEVSPLLFGAKFRIFDGWKWVPQIAFMANLTVPVYNQFDTGVHLAPSLYCLFQNDVCRWFRIGYCLGLEWDGVIMTPATLLSIFFEFNLTKNFIFFAESYNYFTTVSKKKTIADCHMDLGFNYEVDDAWELYLYSSFNYQKIGSYYDVGVGFVWSFD